MLTVDCRQFIPYHFFMPVTTFPQVKSTSIRESVVEAIRHALYDGRFQPGQSLSEAALASEMQISRGPVREALLLLAQEGLVIHSPNRGFSVVKLTAQDMREIQQVRMPLETLALQLAAPNCSDADFEVLENLRQRMLTEYQNLRVCAQFDMAFHSLIWERAGNTRLASTLATLLSPLFAYGSLFTTSRPQDLVAHRIADEHNLLLACLKGQTKMTAEECIRVHLGL